MFGFIFDLPVSIRVYLWTVFLRLYFFVVQISQALFFGAFVVEVGEHVEQKICVARDGDDDGKFKIGCRKFKGSAVDFDNLTKSRNAVVTIAFGIDDLAFVK